MRSVLVEFHDGLRIVDARELLAECFDLFVIAETPDAHTPNVFA